MSSSTTCSRDKASITGSGKTKHIQGSGTKTTCTDRVFTNGLMEESTLANSSTTSKKEKELLSGQTAGNISAAGRVISSMAKESMRKRESRKLVFGPKAKGNSG